MTEVRSTEAMEVTETEVEVLRAAEATTLPTEVTEVRSTEAMEVTVTDSVSM